MAPVSIVRREARKELVGVDVFLHWKPGTPDDLGRRMEALAGEGLRLNMISNRGVKVYPGGFPETFCTDHWRCRYLAAEGQGGVAHAQVVALLQRVAAAGFDFIKTENLYTFDGQSGYTLAQGE
jgi:isocitrate dehydrogenase